MRIDILTIFPEMFSAYLEASLIGRARAKGLLQVEAHDLRAHSTDRHRSVDDEPYGGGGGMVMTAPPWLAAVRSLSEPPISGKGPRRLLMSPQGRTLNEDLVRELAAEDHLILLCGRYEGIDERVRELVVDDEVSVGDYVLSGGEVPAMVVVESISRQIPGVVGLQCSVENDSFRDGILDYPHYTRPPEVEGLSVPPVLLSGDHGAVAAWRHDQALAATKRKRPDLLQDPALPDGEPAANRACNKGPEDK